ncbi:probable inactive DNA (cytosine-5)-methyltransferase DRM3 [Primulina huaijiensis]|uniref:probable inactive DNA (cytosine-5)-methyltransferase DRM3 n=1 Tax=Primulina huaijiensis TaxID=1492673 RepID=UPI003CC73EBB
MRTLWYLIMMLESNQRTRFWTMIHLCRKSAHSMGWTMRLSSSQSNLRSAFVGMGFLLSLIDKTIEENGERNTELLLETLFAYSALHKPESPDLLITF